MRVTDCPSPNFGARRGGARPDMVVIHYTGMADCGAARDRLCDPSAEVSAHYLISEEGEVFALVPEGMRAWHAGAGAWGAVQDVNSRSIGVELANSGKDAFPDPQMVALETLLSGIMVRWRILPHRVIGHSDMAPERKDDPGPLFDWARLARRGLSIWPGECAAAAGGAGSAGGRNTVANDPAGIDTGAFIEQTRIFGYPDADFGKVLAAFRSRFRPDASGPLDPIDLALVSDLARRFPVDRVAVRA